MGDPPIPPGPGAVLLTLGRDPPALVVGDQPVGGAGVGGGAHQPRADRVEQCLAELEDLAAFAHPLFPHRLDHGVVGGEGLGGGGGGGEGGAQQEGRRAESLVCGGAAHGYLDGVEG